MSFPSNVLRFQLAPRLRQSLWHVQRPTLIQPGIFAATHRRGLVRHAAANESLPAAQLLAEWMYRTGCAVSRDVATAPGAS